ncbi:nitrile hydratase accessory protein [Nocardia sp. NPDC059239]|uniref:nitrile hydratase accessory protein n=1 Tax=unclassified Nocardia TaxID=2637762 RepID=UPI0036A120DC
MSAGPRPDAAELGDTRRRIEELVCGMPGTDDHPFDQPWELRAFAMAVAAYHGGHYQWSEFQLSLIESIQRWERGEGDDPWSYYAHWLDALETVLASKGVLSGELLDQQAQAVLAIPRNANHHEAHRDPVAISPALTR